MNDVISDQRELFQLIDEFFQRATGKRASAFASLAKFPEAVHSLTSRAEQVEHAFVWGIPRLYELYGRQRMNAYSAAMELGGMKVVVGGGRFLRTHLNSVKRMTLYTDTVLIPDPILAWIETPRPEEQFRHVQLLEAMFFLLRLKPFIDSECAVPPVLVFPSYERTLAQRDPITKESIDRFSTGLFSRFFGHAFDDLYDVARFATRRPNEFLEKVQENRLFVAPGGLIDEPLSEAIERYRHEMSTGRSDEFLSQLDRLTDSELVCQAIFERFEPQYHLIENAQEMNAQPLLAVEQQAHYFRLCADESESRLRETGIVSPTTSIVIKALSQQKFEWLSHASIDALVQMRMNNENEKFRDSLAKAAGQLSISGITDIDRVAGEVSRGIASLLNEHNQTARKLEEKYKPKFNGMAATGWITYASLIVPHLSPFIAGVPAVSLGGAYLKTKLEQRKEKRELGASLLGILAAAKESLEDLE